MAEQRKRKIPSWLWVLIGLVGVLLVVFALVVGPWLFTRFPHEGITAEQELKAKNDVRTTLVQALAGLAVAGGVIVTYRTYRQNKEEQERTYQLRKDEQDSRQLEQDRTYQQNRIEQDRTYEQTRIEQDRTYERELYATAIEQLGHENAPVRLGALYSLATLGQERPHRRQMVVDVLCAYLRMPYAPPPEPSDAPPDQERQVRLTAERLLSEHVRRPDGISAEDAQHLTPSPDESYWPNISLDLIGAFLIGLNLRQALVVDARFAMATFSNRVAWFTGATFTGKAWFDGATFTGDAWFVEATFTGTAWFSGAKFTGDALFTGATFTGNAWFSGAKFTGDVLFTGAKFTGAWFDKATFTRSAWFNPIIGTASFYGAKVLNLKDPALKDSGKMPLRVWPNGWIVRANADDPTRGTLVHEPPGSSSEPPDG